MLGTGYSLPPFLIVQGQGHAPAPDFLRSRDSLRKRQERLGDLSSNPLSPPSAPALRQADGTSLCFQKVPFFFRGPPPVTTLKTSALLFDARRGSVFFSRERHGAAPPPPSVKA